MGNLSGMWPCIDSENGVRHRQPNLVRAWYKGKSIPPFMVAEVPWCKPMIVSDSLVGLHFWKVYLQ